MRVEKKPFGEQLLSDSGKAVAMHDMYLTEGKLHLLFATLTREQLAASLPHLQSWAETGSLELPKQREDAAVARRLAPHRPSTNEYCLNTEEAARVLGVSAYTLRDWRCSGREKIPYRKIGTKVLYSKAGLEAWLASRGASSTSEFNQQRKGGAT